MNGFSGKKQADILNVQNPKLQTLAPEPKLMRTALGRDLAMARSTSLGTSLTHQSKQGNTQLSCRIPFTEMVINTTLGTGGCPSLEYLQRQEQTICNRQKQKDQGTLEMTWP